MSQVSLSCVQLLADPDSNAQLLGISIKPRIAPLVENIYGFNTSHAPESISSNATLAQMLLKDMNFVFVCHTHFATSKTLTPEQIGS
jgi:hypothetical protein